MSKASKFIFALSVCCCFAIQLRAQGNRGIPILPYVNRDSVAQKDSVPQKDFYDVLKRLMGKKKSTIPHKDTITSKPTISVIPAVGYTLTTGFAFSLSGNMQFRLDSTSRVSTFTASASISSKKQITIPIQSTIWLKNSNYVLIGDIRLYKYPQSTFGLGTNSKTADEDPMNFNYIRFYETALRKITGNLYLGAGYIIDYYANISEKGTKDGAPSAYAMYGTSTHSVSSGLTLNALFDNRDNAINASKGAYASMQLRTNFEFLGSNSGWQSLIIDARKYFKFPAGSDNVLAFWNYDWVVISGKPPYLNLPANAWDSYSTTGRGYIQGRFRGAQMIYLESEYRFKITANGLLGGVLFANAETFSGAPGSGLQKIQPAFGPGLRIKLNKVSKTNVGIDYGIGRGGSGGLFVCVGEVF
jgi:outer membrane protein assembly factor BamA